MLHRLKRIEEIEQLVLFAFGNRGMVLARSLITSSNRETRIVPMYHEIRIVSAVCIIIDQATSRNRRGILDRIDSLSRLGTLVVPCS